MSRINLLIFLVSTSIFSFSSNVQARLQGEGIRGGDDAEEGEFPYQVSVNFLGSSMCGGTIIGERHVVTAAHCVTRNGLLVQSPLNVVAGTSDLKSNAVTKVTVDVMQVYIPKEYNHTDRSRRETGDIAVLKLSKDLGIASNPNLAIAELPKQNEIHENIEAITTGFGYNTVDVVTSPYTGKLEEANGHSSDKMRYARAKVISTDECNTINKKYPLKPVTSKHLCASLVQRDPEEPEGVCSGDSGGPLVYGNTLIAVVSKGPIGCREDSRPAVYTRVSYFVDFIHDAVEDNVTDDMYSTTLKIWNSS